MRRLYPGSDAIVAIANDMKEDLASLLGMNREAISTVDNPLVGPGLATGQAFAAKAGEMPEHPWFSDGGPPVILGCGRLTQQKDFPTLVRAFALMRPLLDVRLMILGKGGHRRTTSRNAIA